MCFSRSPLTKCCQGKGSTPLYCHVWVEVQVPHIASFDTLGKADLIIYGWRWISVFLCGLTDPGGWGGLTTAEWWWKLWLSFGFLLTLLWHCKEGSCVDPLLPGEDGIARSLLGLHRCHLSMGKGEMPYWSWERIEVKTFQSRWRFLPHDISLCLVAIISALLGLPLSWTSG